jgi:nucleoredoxin
MSTFWRRGIRLMPAVLILTPLFLFGDAFLSWDDLLGRSFEAKVVSVGARTVKLENREGKQIDFPMGDLMPSSRKQVDAWLKAERDASLISAAEEPQVSYKESVFDGVLIGNLERLKGKRLKKCSDATRPKKYYLFYYTASWCGPCQRFTPTLVEWYNDNKNENFELILISSDRSEDAMESYARDKDMPWPQLEHDKVSDFRKKFDHGVTGIPSLLVCELDGKVLGNFRGRLSDITKMVK